MVTPKNFLQWLEYAINKVGPGYYGFVERVYCYELYHYLRMAMHQYEERFGEIKDLYLHSELVKAVLTNVEAGSVGVIPLDGRRSPDFILHQPNNINHQIAAMEVKTAPRLTYHDFIEDVVKLSRLRERYRYELVVFHCINVSLERINSFLIDAESEGLALDRNVLIFLKQDYQSVACQFYIGDFYDAYYRK